MATSTLSPETCRKRTLLLRASDIVRRLRFAPGVCSREFVAEFDELEAMLTALEADNAAVIDDFMAAQLSKHNRAGSTGADTNGLSGKWGQGRAGKPRRKAIR